jgi:hypothetical protein
MQRSLVAAALLGGLLALTPQPAYAYIDPAMGSLLLQSLMAGFLAVGAAWAGFKMKITSLLDRRKDKDKAKGEK